MYASIIWLWTLIISLYFLNPWTFTWTLWVFLRVSISSWNQTDRGLEILSQDQPRQSLVYESKPVTCWSVSFIGTGQSQMFYWILLNEGGLCVHVSREERDLTQIQTIPAQTHRHIRQSAWHAQSTEVFKKWLAEVARLMVDVLKALCNTTLIGLATGHTYTQILPQAISLPLFVTSSFSVSSALRLCSSSRLSARSVA